jgi:uncharacterized protein YecE (DUF72 family)
VSAVPDDSTNTGEAILILGPVLYQLPPGCKLDRGRLEHFLQVLPRGAKHVLDFRNPTWYADDVYTLMESHGDAPRDAVVLRRLLEQAVEGDARRIVR